MMEKTTSRRDLILAIVGDIAIDLLYYDRKDDEIGLPVGAIEEAVRGGEVTVEEMLELFEKSLRAGLRGQF